MEVLVGTVKPMQVTQDPTPGACNAWLWDSMLTMTLGEMGRSCRVWFWGTGTQAGAPASSS